MKQLNVFLGLILIVGCAKSYKIVTPQPAVKNHSAVVSGIGLFEDSKGCYILANLDLGNTQQLRFPVDSGICKNAAIVEATRDVLARQQAAKSKAEAAEAAKAAKSEPAQ